MTVTCTVASVVALQLSVARTVIVCVPAGVALFKLITPVLLTLMPPVYVPAFCTAMLLTLPLSLRPVAAFCVVLAPTPILMLL